MIDHDILLSKINNYGIRGLANDWFKNYLSGRQQYVDIVGVTSHIRVKYRSRYHKAHFWDPYFIYCM